MPKKRSKERPVSSNDPPSADETRESVIARLLQSREAGSSPLADQNTTGRPIIQDASEQVSKPKFEMPDLTSSASLLARVQSFLPQLQQANTSLPTDHTGGSAFELIEENSDDDDDNEDDDAEGSNIRSMQQGGSDEDSEDDETVDAQPQIVMNLALGVLEEQKHNEAGPESSSDEGSSDEESSEQEQAIGPDTKHDGDSQKHTTASENLPQLAMPNSAKRTKKPSKPLIQEMS